MLDNTSHILILMAAGLLGLAVNLAGNASQSIESKEVVVLVVEEQPDEVMVGGKLACLALHMYHELNTTCVKIRHSALPLLNFAHKVESKH